MNCSGVLAPVSVLASIPPPEDEPDEDELLEDELLEPEDEELLDELDEEELELLEDELLELEDEELLAAGPTEHQAEVVKEFFGKSDVLQVKLPVRVA